jgi:nucleoid-associated protein YgaU
MNSPRDSKKRLRSWVLGMAAVAALPSYASTPKSPEQETLEIAKTLKPIPNNEWSQIAGDKITEKYEISKGDTLYDISKRLFGDSKYWPKIWSLNNHSITNPHMIRPGNAISFQGGTGSSFPSVSMEVADSGMNPEQQPNTANDAEAYGHPPRATEWQNLPEQDWENVQLQTSPAIDPLGFDSRSKVKTHRATGFELPLMVATQKIQSLGRIFASETASEFISLDQIVFIHPDGDVQIGQTYSLTDESEKLESKSTERVGYAYALLGQVKILEAREGMFVGVITSSTHPMSRGAILVPLQPKVRDLAPIPGPSQLQGVMLMDRQYSTSSSAQHKIVFIDRGSDDGVTPGMIFRNYEHTDPANSKRITKAGILINADIMVVQTSPKFCTGLITNSYDYVTEGSPVTLLTDVSALLRGPVPNQWRLELNSGTPPDELDSLDHGNGLTDEEKRELKQLEKWKKNNPNPEASGAPENDLVPPPPTVPEKGAEEIPPPPTSEIPPPPTEKPTAEIPPPPTAPVVAPKNTEEVPPPPPAEAPAAPPANSAPTSATQVPPASPEKSTIEVPPPLPEPEAATPKNPNAKSPVVDPNAAVPPAPLESGHEESPAPPANEPAIEAPLPPSETLPPPPPPAQ